MSRLLKIPMHFFETALRKVYGITLRTGGIFPLSASSEGGKGPVTLPARLGVAGEGIRVTIQVLADERGLAYR